MKERLQKFIAGAGVSSRRRAEELITSGYVAVNGKIITRLGTTIDPDHDKVTVNGRPVARPTTHRYIALNKPYAVVCRVTRPLESYRLPITLLPLPSLYAVIR